MSEFQREHRYIVAKLKHLSEDAQKQIIDILQREGHPPLESVVIESDWACYQEAWALVEREARWASIDPELLKEGVVDPAVYDWDSKPTG